jgi:hypothetical protein
MPPPNQINFIKSIQGDWVIAIDDEAWDDLVGEGQSLNTSWYVEDITKAEEAHNLTRGGRHFKPSYLEEDYLGRDPPPVREADKTKVSKEIEKDKVLAQLKKT